MPLRELASGQRGAGAAPAIDLIAVHGLNAKLKEDEAHARDTWTKNERLWLRDDLPRALPAARVLLAVYDSNPAFGSRDRFVRQASSLLEEIRMRRDGVKDRPIVFVAHSLGGILVKQALVNAKNNPVYEDIFQAVRGLVFFGVPHAGGERAAVLLGNIAANIAQSIMPKGVSKDIMEALKNGSLYSDILKDMFRHQLENFAIVSFYERLGRIGKHVIVPYENATLGLAGARENQMGLDADHSDMCKFDTRLQHDRDLYEIAEFNICKTCERALGAVKQSRDLSRPEIPQGPPDNAYDFAIALEHVESQDGTYLAFRRGSILEDIRKYNSLNETIYFARLRGRMGRIPGESVILIVEDEHQQKLAQFSSRELYQLAVKQGASFAEALFAERPDHRCPLQLTFANTGLDTCYVDWDGHLHPQALHLAIIGQDHAVLDFLLGKCGKYGRISINSSQRFPALQLQRTINSAQEWAPYVKTDWGTPLTAAVNRYIACRYLDEPSDEWMGTIMKLLSNGATWKAFVDGKPLLGSTVAAERADAGTMVHAAIHFNHDTIMHSILKAEPPLLFEPLRAAALFDSPQWWIAPLTELEICGKDATQTLQSLRECLDSLAGSKQVLAEAVPSAMWECIDKLTLPQAAIDTLFCHLMQQLERWTDAPSAAAQEAVLQQLRALLRAQPDLDAWGAPAAAERVSVLHFCVERALDAALAAFLADGRSAPNVNLPFPDDGDLPLDRAQRRGNPEAAQLLRRHGAKGRNYAGPARPKLQAPASPAPGASAGAEPVARPAGSVLTAELEPWLPPPPAATSAYSEPLAAIEKLAYGDQQSVASNPYSDGSVVDWLADKEAATAAVAAAQYIRMQPQTIHHPFKRLDPFQPPMPNNVRVSRPVRPVRRLNPFRPT